ncbi:hypothetical protein UFOVP589_47 [uncultured Caudovirales phage]|jgi:hypothetical protein|uniref:Uncharacterized protein n=1 Tax=uncultured Caudovirales phage TaxID=2100421 RepID=A0A6J5N0Y9_9CAUD|nr:hypothetical protein UFOVP589_47 [uncultured Caudovirales phage]
MKLREFIEDLIGIICIFGLCYAGLIIGYGIGW